jgi:hypothetical protein
VLEHMCEATIESLGRGEVGCVELVKIYSYLHGVVLVREIEAHGVCEVEVDLVCEAVLLPMPTQPPVGCYSGVTAVLQWCYRGVTMV